MHDEIRREHVLNIFFGENSLKNKTFSVQQGDYNSNELICNQYSTNENGKSDQIDLEEKTVTVVFKRENGKPTPEYSTEIDDTHVGRVRFCIPHRILTKAGDAVQQLKIYGDDSLLNSVILPFEIEKSINDCGHDGCVPVTLQVIQKVESAIEELELLKDEFEEAEVARQEQFEEWQDKIENMSHTDQEVVNSSTRQEFPEDGDAGKIYKAQDESRLYQWNPTLADYEPLSSSAGSIDNITIIHGGNANVTA